MQTGCYNGDIHVVCELRRSAQGPLPAFLRDIRWLHVIGPVNRKKIATVKRMRDALEMVCQASAIEPRYVPGRAVGAAPFYAEP